MRCNLGQAGSTLEGAASFAEYSLLQMASRRVVARGLEQIARQVSSFVRIREQLWLPQTESC